MRGPYVGRCAVGGRRPKILVSPHFMDFRTSHVLCFRRVRRFQDPLVAGLPWCRAGRGSRGPAWPAVGLAVATESPANTAVVTMALNNPQGMYCATFCAITFHWKGWPSRNFLLISGNRRRMSGVANIVVDVKEEMALRSALEAAVMRAALDQHYAQFPETRPDLADIAVATAELDGNPLAADPDRIRRAAAEIAAAHPHPEPEDVLLWAEARAFPS
jgi:hypothetical protein